MPTEMPDKLLAEQLKQLTEINSSLESRIEKAIAEQRNKDIILIQQSRFKAMDEIINSIAHRWRQPVNNIGLIAQSLQLGVMANDLPAEELSEGIAEIMGELQQVSDNINDFLDLFSHEEEASSFNVNEQVSRALSFVEPSLKAKGIRVEVDEEPDVITDGYPNEYLQAVLNIMLNARDALCKHHDGNPVISIRIFVDNAHSVVTVRDNGGGIEEDILPRIFEPFFTTKRQDSGAGIGLFIAKMIIEKQMNGTLSACNVGEGAEFRIEV